MQQMVQISKQINKKQQKISCISDANIKNNKQIPKVTNKPY
jgi:hypothetical protein